MRSRQSVRNEHIEVFLHSKAQCLLLEVGVLRLELFQFLLALLHDLLLQQFSTSRLQGRVLDTRHFFLVFLDDPLVVLQELLHIHVASWEIPLGTADHNLLRHVLL